jgi:peptidyl-prolyl cis-trans isomerase B (cyclophilin B)
VSSKREREYERRRLEKWQARQAKARAARRRRNVVAGAVVAAAVVVVAIVVAVVHSTGSAAATASQTPTPSGSSSAAALDYSPRTGNGGVVPDASLAEGRTWQGTILLNRGELEISLDGAAAPQAVANFVTLAKEGYFDMTKCHRLDTSIKVLQCGDPTATGSGGPGYTWGPIENAPSDGSYAAGTIAMARVSGDGSSMGSQFFIVYGDTTINSDAAGGYTVFGKVTSGLDVLQAIADEGTVEAGQFSAPAHDVVIERVETQ